MSSMDRKSTPRMTDLGRKRSFDACARVVRHSALHGETTIRTKREGHRGLAGRRIVGGALMRRKSRVWKRWYLRAGVCWCCVAQLSYFLVGSQSFQGVGSAWSGAALVFRKCYFCDVYFDLTAPFGWRVINLYTELAAVSRFQGGVGILQRKVRHKYRVV